MDNNVLTIYADDIELAQNSCSSISDSDTRNRAVANVLAVMLAERFFNSINYQTDLSTGLHNIPNVVENLDIADIYLNGAYIDVRVYFSNDEISVPKFHSDIGVNPAAYMFIQLNSDLSGYKVAGFIRPEHINKNNLKDNYYYINENELISFYDIESFIKEVPDTFDGSKEILYSFVDGSIDENKIAELLRVLVSSANARKTLIKAFKANSLFRFVSSVPTESDTVNKSNEQTEPAESYDTVQESISNETNIEEDVLDSEDLYNALEYSTEVTPNPTTEQENVETENEEQIDSLFTGEQEGVPVNKKSSSKGRIAFLLVALFLACGFYCYTKFFYRSDSNSLPDYPAPAVTEEQADIEGSASPVDKDVTKAEAMPDETVSGVNNTPATTEEAAAVAIPAIEQHLDASVLVSNLKVDWEVPSGYASNTSAKRYLVKLGKIIQLNLKSELLLLTKPPISNRITVELTFNKDRGKFEIVGITNSSGEKSVDEVILNTIRMVLNQSTSSAEAIDKLQGNPVLIIRL